MVRTKKAEPIATPEVDAVEQDDRSIEVIHDTDSNTVSFEVSGHQVTLREPKAKDFMLMESWRRQAASDYQDVSIMMIKLASLCVVKWDKKPAIAFQEMFDSLETFDDIERVAAAMQFFRSAIDAYVERLGRTGNDAGNADSNDSEMPGA